MTQVNKNSLLYTAREFDFDTGLQFNRTMYYNPNLGSLQNYCVNIFYNYSYIENNHTFVSNVEYLNINFFKLNRILMKNTKYDSRTLVIWDDCWAYFIFDDETSRYVGYIAKRGCVISSLKL